MPQRWRNEAWYFPKCLLSEWPSSFQAFVIVFTPCIGFRFSAISSGSLLIFPYILEFHFSLFNDILIDVSLWVNFVSKKVKLGLSKCKLSFLLKCTVPMFSRSFYLTHSISELIKLILEIYVNDCRLSVDILFYLSSAIKMRDWMELFTLFSRTGNNTGGGQLVGGMACQTPSPPQPCLFCIAKVKTRNEGEKRLLPMSKCHCFSHSRASTIHIFFSVPWPFHFEIHFARPFFNNRCNFYFFTA